MRKCVAIKISTVLALARRSANAGSVAPYQNRDANFCYLVDAKTFANPKAAIAIITAAHLSNGVKASISHRLVQRELISFKQILRWTSWPIRSLCLGWHVLTADWVHNPFVASQALSKAGGAVVKLQPVCLVRWQSVVIRRVALKRAP
jgi:hypothetical protein